MKCRIRRATEEDCELLFQWANDSLVRQNSFSSTPISWEEHTAWYADLRKRADCGQYIYLCEEEPVGQARVTVSGEEAEVGYSICAASRGMGHGTRILQMLADAVKKDFPQVKTMVAKVKTENTASQKAFEHIGYREEYRVYTLDMESKPAISVIVPCYNMSEYLPDCLKSLERQTIGMEKLQIILVDDASLDEGKTWQIITEFERCHPNNCVAVHLEENRRQGGAKNAGLQYAEGEYLAFVDADDWIEADMYETMYQYAKSRECDIVDCRMRWEYSDGNRDSSDAAPDENCGEEETLVTFEKSIMEGGTHWITRFCVAEESAMVTRLYRRELILDTGLSFPEKLRYEDNFLGDMILLYVKNFCHIRRYFYHYRQHGTSTMHKRNQSYHFDRLQIELMKLGKYHELGIAERFHWQIERDFLNMYYCNTLRIIWGLFDEPPYEIYLEMVKTVRKLFPDYRENPYLQMENIQTVMLSLIEKDLSREQFLAAGKMIIEYINTET